MKKRWNINKFYSKKNNYEEKVTSLIIEEILQKRGISGKKEVNKFLNPELNNLYNPYKLKDMKIAVDRIIKAIKRDEKIIIYGDYDVDGITSTTLLYYYFKERFNKKVDYYLPDRIKEGYGLNQEAIKKIHDKEYDLIITVDCGITAHKEIDLATNYNIDIIVTDHHQPGKRVPEGIATIDPYQGNDAYPFSQLAGVGVAFKLCQALEKQVSNNFINSFLLKQLDIVAIGSVADIVPLKDENRILVSKGLDIISKTNKLGLKTLIDQLGLDSKNLTPGQIGYILAPPLNAAGRMKSADLGIKLLITENKQKAKELAGELVSINKKRQQEEQKTFKQAVNMIEDINLNKQKAIILSSKKWHPGIIGIVASRLVEKYYYPVILIALQDNIGKGSCRSINNLNIYNTLKKCSTYLMNYGGHSQAAGLTIKKKNIKKFKNQISNYLNKKLEKNDLIPVLNLDVIIDIEDINKNLLNQINKLKPFGVGNPEPRILINRVKVKNSFTVGKNNEHLKLKLENNLEAIAFELGHLNNLVKNKTINLAACISINKWNNREKIQLKVKDINICSDINFYPLEFQCDTKQICIYDKRGINQKKQYLERHLDYNKKIAVYQNNITKLKKMVSYFNKKNVVIDIDSFKELRKNNKGFIFFSSPKNISQGQTIEELVFLSLPFSLDEFRTIVENFDFSNSRKNLHFLFNKNDYYTNKKLMKKNLPTYKFIKKVYKNINKYAVKKEIAVTNIDDIINLNYNKKILNKTLAIFKELGLINYEEKKIELLHNNSKLDLSESVRYNKIIRTINQFNEFCNLVFKKNLFTLIEKI
ncbi:MAG: single-stranded-DNA-specific exonuclease RecJ [Halanaerobiaceae bacterium]